jgi:FkbM family methyltransferase
VRISGDYHESKTFFAELRAAGHNIKKIRDSNLVTVYGDIELGNYCFVVRRRTSDIHVAKLVLMEKEYRPLIDLIFQHSDQESIKYIVDAGANVGYTTIFFKKIFPNAACFAVEPATGNYKVLLENVRHNNLKDIFPVQAALWISPMKLMTTRSFRDGRDWAISVVEASNENANTVEGITISKLMEHYSVPRIDVLKMDIEGAEALIFSADAHPERFLSRVKFLALEIHEETKCRGQIVETLRENGFTTSFHGETVFGVNWTFR